MAIESLDPVGSESSRPMQAAIDKWSKRRSEAIQEELIRQIMAPRDELNAVLPIQGEYVPEAQVAFLSRFQRLMGDDVIVSLEFYLSVTVPAGLWSARAEFIQGGTIYRLRPRLRSPEAALLRLYRALRDRRWDDLEYFVPEGWRSTRRRLGRPAICPREHFWRRRPEQWGPPPGTRIPVLVSGKGSPYGR